MENKTKIVPQKMKNNNSGQLKKTSLAIRGIQEPYLSQKGVQIYVSISTVCIID